MLHDWEDGAKQCPAKHVSSLKLLQTVTEDGNVAETEPPVVITPLNNIYCQELYKITVERKPALYTLINNIVM